MSASNFDLETWLVRIVTDDGKTIDFYGALSYKERQRVTDDDLISLLTPEVESINVRECENLTDAAFAVVADKCRNLRTLDISRCFSFTGAAFTAIAGKCENLTTLNASDMSDLLTDPVFAVVADECKNLRTLDISGCQGFTDATITAIAGKCESLRTLDISRCWSFTDAAFAAVLGKCRNLTTLDISRCFSFTGAAITVVKCENLTTLNLGWCKENLTDAVLKAFADKCKNLKALDIWACANFTDAAIAAVFAKFEKLTSFRLTTENLTDAAFTVAGKCRNLTTLRIGDNVAFWKPDGGLTAAALTAIAGKCRNLTTLDVACCKNLTDAAFAVVADKCKNLASLSVSKSENLTGAALAAVASKCRHLTTLDVWDSNSITKGIITTGITAVLDNCENLTSLNVFGIADAAFTAVAGNCENLSTLKISDCESDFTDAALRAIADKCRNLREFDLSICLNPFDVGIAEMADKCRHLTRLDCYQCYGITQAALAAFADNCSQLTHLVLTECGVDSLPKNIGSLSRLQLLGLRGHELLSALPWSIVKLDASCELDVFGCPLRTPPCEVAEKGIPAIRRYFEELKEAGAEVSTELKVVLCGDARAGKTSLRNALAGRVNPRQHEDARTIHLDRESICLLGNGDDRAPEDDETGLNELTINVSDMGGQEEYAVAQTLFLQGPALFVLVVEAARACDDHADDVLLRFLDLLQTRAPKATVLLVLSKVDKLDNDAKRIEERCTWLLRTTSERFEAWRAKSSRVDQGRQIPIVHVEQTVFPVLVEGGLEWPRSEGVDQVRNEIIRLAASNRFRNVGQIIPKTWGEVCRFVLSEATGAYHRIEDLEKMFWTSFRETSNFDEHKKYFPTISNLASIGSPSTTRSPSC